MQAPPSDAADETAEDFDRVNAVNLRGVWAAQKHELRQMRGRGSGAIVNCSAAMWLCSPAVSFVVGAVLPVDGGYTTH